MPSSLAKRFLLITLLIPAMLLAGCGYEHHPVRVRWSNQTSPPEPTSPETFLTYGLQITPPWANGGYLVLSAPDLLQANSGATTLFSWDDLAFTIACPKCVKPTLFTAPAGSKTVRCPVCKTKLPVLASYVRRNVWVIASDERTATLDLESPSTPGVFLTIKLRVEGSRLDFNLTLRNDTNKDLRDVSANLLCNFANLAGFHPDSEPPFDRCFVLVKGAVAPMTNMDPTNFEMPGRNAWVNDPGNPDARPRVDHALLVLSDTQGKRKFLFSWEPGKNVSVYPDHLMVAPLLGNIPAGRSGHATGVLLFSEASTEDLLKQVPSPGK